MKHDRKQRRIAATRYAFVIWRIFLLLLLYEPFKIRISTSNNDYIEFCMHGAYMHTAAGCKYFGKSRHAENSVHTMMAKG